MKKIIGLVNCVELKVIIFHVTNVALILQAKSPWQLMLNTSPGQEQVMFEFSV